MSAGVGFRGLHVPGREREPRRRSRRELTPAGGRVSASQLRALAPGSNRAHEALVDACLTYLRMHGIPAIPIHTGPRVAPNGDGSFQLRKNRRQAGFGDIVAPLPPDGQLLLVDVKTGRAHLSAEQVELHERFARTGARCLVVREVSDLAEIVAAARRERPRGGRA